MNYQLTVTDEQKQHLVVLTLSQEIVSQAAADVVFQVLAAPADELVDKGILAEGQVQDLKILQNAIFDADDQGPFIRENIGFRAGLQDLDPDAPLLRSFTQSERDGTKYMRLQLTALGTGTLPGSSASPADSAAAYDTPAAVANQAPGGSVEDQIRDLSHVMLIHQIARGYVIDVTKELPELTEAISWAEKNELIEIDVQKVAYKLTEKGKRLHDSYIAEAQDLIKRFDIYGNVDSDNNGFYFDTGLGRDLRVPAFEMEGVDPFRARFLLGINDGEWDKLADWPEFFTKESWYREIFAPIEQAPSVEQVGHEKMAAIMTSAKAILRQEQQNR